MPSFFIIYNKFEKMIIASLLNKMQGNFFSVKNDGFSLYSGITDNISEYFKSHFAEKIWLRNYSQQKSVKKCFY
jgi:hypothetical protein